MYAQSEDEALQAQKAMIDFVKVKYDRGILVTADKIVSALSRFKDNVIVNQFLK